MAGGSGANEKTEEAAWELTIILPFDLPLGCATWDATADLIKHTIFSGRWDDLVLQRFLTVSACKMVPPKSQMPTVAWRHLAAITLGTRNPTPLGATISTLNRIGSIQEGKGFFVNLPSQLVTLCRRRLGAMLAGRSYDINAQETSPASTTDLPRTRLLVSFPIGEAHDVGILAIMQDIRHAFSSRPILVARDCVFADPNALLAELSCSDVAFKICDVCDEIVFVSKSLVTLKTDKAQLSWKALLDHLWHDDLSSSCLFIKWKRSRMGGRTWVQAPPLKPTSRQSGRKTTCQVGKVLVHISRST